MSRLPLEKRVQILSMLVEGSAMHSISRVCDVSIGAVSKLLVDAGGVCADFHHERVQGVTLRRFRCNEIWSFREVTAKSVAAVEPKPCTRDLWTWTALDVDSNLILSWIVGGLDAGTATLFLKDLMGRFTDGVQPPRNLTTGMSMRRVARLTNELSNKLSNHCHALALYFFWHNWCRTNDAVPVSPAMAVGLTDKLMDMTDIAKMVEAAAPKPGPRRRYGTDADRAERDRLAALAQFEAELNPIKLVIQEEWTLPPDLRPEDLTRVADELRRRIQTGQSRERLYLRVAFVQVHDMKMPFSPAHRRLVDRVYALLRGENSK
jgi:hypothetical protein